ncbi:MAG TPA: LacI family DNA-binding transcriptional regulator [Propionibacteriaceae bacterium]|nr:LacI family DNA-binding transcriptional regulator [Propionibacteriaceae bacterium]
MATIYDVATRAGVSPATVSRVLNGVEVNGSMKEAVLEAAAALQYVPNRTARTLRRRTSEIIAMVIPDLENPFFTSMTRAVAEQARASGYTVMLCDTAGRPDREAEYLRVMVSESVAGLIVAPASDAIDLDEVIERGLPVVCVDRTAPGYDLDTVVVDNVGGARRSVEILQKAGFRDIACISGPEHVETAEQRTAGWREAVVAATGAAPDPAYDIRTSYSVSGGESAMNALLDLPRPPDAVFAANNLLAVGSLRALSAHGLTPPAYGVLAFGDLPLLTYTPLGVVVVHLPSREIGEVAAARLLERIDGFSGPARHIVLPNIVTDDQSAMELLTSSGYPDPRPSAVG